MLANDLRDIIDVWRFSMYSAFTLYRDDIRQVLNITASTSSGKNGVSIASSFGPNANLNINGDSVLNDLAQDGTYSFGQGSIAVKDPARLARTVIKVNQVAIISSYEVIKSDSVYSSIQNYPEVKFLQHLRNGCAHGGIFDVRYPVNNAVWHGMKITQSLNGTPVFCYLGSHGLLNDGDPLILLTEIGLQYLGVDLRK